jgi:hypothetical protein
MRRRLALGCLFLWSAQITACGNGVIEAAGEDLALADAGTRAGSSAEPPPVPPEGMAGQTGKVALIAARAAEPEADSDSDSDSDSEPEPEPEPEPDSPSAPAPGLHGNAYVLTSANRLLGIDFVTAQVIGTLELSGLNEGEAIIGADVRHSAPELTAVTSAGRILVIDLVSGEAEEVSTLAADPEDTTDPFTALAGDRFGVDWDPATDRLWVFGDAGQRLEIDADTGATRTESASDPRSQLAAYALEPGNVGRARLYAVEPRAKMLHA